MSQEISQKYLDKLYDQVFIHRIRCSYNTSSSEAEILQHFVKLYLRYYHTKAKAIKLKLAEKKNTARTSCCMWRNRNFLRQYATYLEEIDRYILNIDSREITDDLSEISPSLSKLFPGDILRPTLLHRMKIEEEHHRDQGVEKTSDHLSLSTNTT